MVLESLELLQTLSGHSDRVWYVAWSPDGRTLASCGSDKTIRLWRFFAETNEEGEDEKKPMMMTEEGERERKEEDEVKIKVMEREMEVFVRKKEKRKRRKTGVWRCEAVLEGEHHRTIRCVSWSTDGQKLAAASFDATASIWEKNKKENSSEWKCVYKVEGHENEVKSISWNASNNYLSTCSRDKTVWVHEATECRLNRNSGDASGGEVENEEYFCAAILNGHTQDVKMVRWHPLDNVIVSCSYDDTIRVWGKVGEEWEPLQTLSGHNSTVWAVSFNSDGLKPSPSPLPSRPTTQTRLDGGGGDSRSRNDDDDDDSDGGRRSGGGGGMAAKEMGKKRTALDERGEEGEFAAAPCRNGVETRSTKSGNISSRSSISSSDISIGGNSEVGGLKSLNNSSSGRSLFLKPWYVTGMFRGFADAADEAAVISAEVRREKGEEENSNDDSNGSKERKRDDSKIWGGSANGGESDEIVREFPNSGRKEEGLFMEGKPKGYLRDHQNYSPTVTSSISNSNGYYDNSDSCDNQIKIEKNMNVSDSNNNVSDGHDSLKASNTRGEDGGFGDSAAAPLPPPTPLKEMAIDEWRCTATIQGYHGRTIYFVDWNSMHDWIATACGDNGLRIFKRQTADESIQWSLAYCQHNAHEADLNCVVWKPTPEEDGSFLLATAGDDGVIRLWRYEDDECE